MANQITVNPTAGASTNPLGITFGATAMLEFYQLPERLINKDITNLELTMVDTTGVYLHKGVLNAVIPWSAIIAMQY